MVSSITLVSGTPDDLVELGRIVSAYGVRGWIKIQPHSVNGPVLLNATAWWLRSPAPLGEAGVLPSASCVQILASRMHGATVVAQLDSVHDRDQAEELKGTTVWVPRSAFPPIEEDEYYWIDLIGCLLYGQDNDQTALIGQVRSVIDNGAHAVLQVARATQDPSGQLIFQQTDKGREVEVLVPFVSAHVHTVDLPNKTLHSNWPLDL